MRVERARKLISVLTLLLFTKLAVSQVVLAPSHSKDASNYDAANNDQSKLGTVIDSSDGEIASDSAVNDDGSDLVIGDHLICNSVECYPKVFEPSSGWKEIRPGQRLPVGLDIRISLEKGTKEAKLPEPVSEGAGGEGNADSEIENVVIDTEGKIIQHSEPDELAEEAVEEQINFVFNDHEVEGGPEPREITEDTTDLTIAESVTAESASNVQAAHEFSKDFAKIKSLAQLSSDEKNWEEVESILDDLVEFAHDYKKGFKILSNEFELLESLSFNDELAVSIRELAARIIISSLRNNPPAIDFVNENYPQTTFKLCEKLAELQAFRGSKPLVKRFLSILDVLLSRTEFVSIKDDVLWSTYKIEDPSSKVKILEIISKFFSERNEAVINNTELDMKTVQKWVNELTTIIQTPELDELHVRSFFHCISYIKSRFKNHVKIDSDFLNWLINEIELRNEAAKNELYKRDDGQLEFDSLLAESRHAIFGNPNAARLKERIYHNDELLADEL
ncbi:unnamed protein product [Kluyveromyces dobzhanskii CBS 2104]|uniref:Nucleotide exchange factor SIL1 n=1 Tax=Kluyveromyces dobzhanskii CBS 2104 TaxID=1427455 RepID=A0A0A8L9E0_9SACH|nr:unnamed protein product [Kluyveromyces dobzhanskii CBS 2104]